MRDFLPQDKIKRERLISTVVDSYIARGFQQIETPVLEDIDRLTSGQGGDNEKLVFKVQKRGEEFTQALESGEELADLGLRFDLTVPLTRFYAFSPNSSFFLLRFPRWNQSASKMPLSA